MYNLPDIVERPPGCSDEMMVRDCEIMLKVLSKSKTLHFGRGKNRSSIQVPYYKNDEMVVDRIKKSIEYYKRCSLENINEK